MAQEHPLVQLARETITSYVCERRVIPPPEDPCEEMCDRRGVFVSLHCAGQLRGCIGTIEPLRGNVAEEIIANAISAATRDPRFPPVTPDEIEGLEISVDVLTEPEEVPSTDYLDPKTYGVIVECDRRRGLLLPDLEGVDTVEQQVSIALQKAWIGPHSPYRIYRFQVLRYR
jgi:AmmeMemoRadiSam system protein A